MALAPVQKLYHLYPLLCSDIDRAEQSAVVPKSVVYFKAPDTSTDRNV